MECQHRIKQSQLDVSNFMLTEYPHKLANTIAGTERQRVLWSFEKFFRQLPELFWTEDISTPIANKEWRLHNFVHSSIKTLAKLRLPLDPLETSCSYLGVITRTALKSLSMDWPSKGLPDAFPSRCDQCANFHIDQRDPSTPRWDFNGKKQYAHNPNCNFS